MVPMQDRLSTSTIDRYSSSFKAKYGTTPGNMGADTYDAFYIIKNAVERAGSLNKTLIRNAIETTNMTQGLLVTESGRIEFNTDPALYHEILGVTFIQQLFWNTTLGECRPLIIYPTIPILNIGFINQTTFELPAGYQPRGP